VSDALRWESDGRDWPNREASSFVQAGGLRWHVQRLGAGPPLLLVHGTAASTHSWAGLAPLLARRFAVIAPDLPGHGFTEAPGPAGLSLPGMSASLAALLDALGIRPQWTVGHSAGAAILLRMCLDGALAPRVVVGLNAALLPLRGLRNPAFAPLSRWLTSGSFLARLIARRAAHPGVVEQLMARTGSRLPAQDLEFYRRLARSPRHVGAAFSMMAMWDLRPLERALPRLGVPLVLLAGTEDGMIRPQESRRVADAVPGAEVRMMPGLGHLAHEEEPAVVAGLVEEIAARRGLQPLA
jgi:magnesium chelatase accessory protein